MKNLYMVNVTFHGTGINAGETEELVSFWIVVHLHHVHHERSVCNLATPHGGSQLRGLVARIVQGYLNRRTLWRVFTLINAKSPQIICRLQFDMMYD